MARDSMANRRNYLLTVYIRARSAADLARLTSIVKSSPKLQFAGGSIEPDPQDDHHADFDADVLLEQLAPPDPEESEFSELESGSIPRVILVSEREFSIAVEAMRAPDSAIHGVLPDYASDAEIRSAIEGVAAGLRVLHPDFMEILIEDNSASLSSAPSSNFSSVSDPSAQLISPRESEVLNLLAQGLANKEIAWRLKISEHTVKFHITSIFNKLNASTRAEAVAIGIRRGLISI